MAIASEGTAPMSAVMVAAMAVVTGQTRHMPYWRALTVSSSRTRERRASAPTSDKARIGGWLGRLLPIGVVPATNRTAWMATRHMHDYGLTREHCNVPMVRE